MEEKRRAPGDSDRVPEARETEKPRR